MGCAFSKIATRHPALPALYGTWKEVWAKRTPSVHCCGQVGGGRPRAPRCCWGDGRGALGRSHGLPFFVHLQVIQCKHKWPSS